MLVVSSGFWLYKVDLFSCAKSNIKNWYNLCYLPFILYVHYFVPNENTRSAMIFVRDNILYFNRVSQNFIKNMQLRSRLAGYTSMESLLPAKSAPHIFCVEHLFNNPKKIIVPVFTCFICSRTWIKTNKQNNYSHYSIIIIPLVIIIGIPWLCISITWLIYIFITAQNHWSYINTKSVVFWFLICHEWKEPFWLTWQNL